MGVIKDGQEIHQVIIQEGVLTGERMNDAVAEPPAGTVTVRDVPPVTVQFPATSPSCTV